MSLVPQDLLPRLFVGQSKKRDSPLSLQDTISCCPQRPPHTHCGPGESSPHLRMYIEVFIGFKALFFTLRVVKKKALFDDEKPVESGGKRGTTRREG